MIHRLGWVAFCVLGLALGGCDSSAGSAGVSAGMGGAGGGPRLVVTADWLNQSPTLLDYAKLVGGESDGPSSVVDTIDLSEWEPGPIEVEVTPDGKTAVVSVDVAGTMSEVLATGSDPSDVSCLDGNDRAAVANTLNFNVTLQLSGENFPLAAAADSAGDFAFVAHIVDPKLSIIELQTGTSRAVTWLSGPSPSYVAVQP